MPLSQSGRKLLSSDDIVARASDIQAETCKVCLGEGFLFTDTLCPNCLGSGAIVFPKQKRHIEFSGRAILWAAVGCLILAGGILSMMPLIYAFLILSQACYWFLLRDETRELADKTWDACVYPGGRNGQ